MKVLWEDAPWLINYSIPLENGIATVQTAAGTNGNAVVAAYDASNTILWSWHIWVTNYVPTTQANVAANTAYTVTGGQVHTYGTRYLAANGNKVIMDRNLGATQSGTITTGTTSAADAPKAFGQYYQWGRKDPLGQWDGASTVHGTSALAPWYNYNKNPAIVTITNTGRDYSAENMIKNPMDLCLGGVGGRLWQDNVKTIFDPCPAGWRVPKDGTWNDFTSTGRDVVGISDDEPYTGTLFPYFINGTQQTASGQWSNTTSPNVRNGRLYQQGSVKAWYPAAGYLGKVEVAGGGSGGWYWSSKVDGYSYYLSFGSGDINPNDSNHHDHSGSVRCIQE